MWACLCEEKGNHVCGVCVHGGRQEYGCDSRNLSVSLRREVLNRSVSLVRGVIQNRFLK